MFVSCLSGCLSELKSLEMKMNAETQRFAEKRRAFFFSAFLRGPLRHSCERQDAAATILFFSAFLGVPLRLCVSPVLASIRISRVRFPGLASFGLATDRIRSGAINRQPVGAGVTSPMRNRRWNTAGQNSPGGSQRAVLIMEVMGTPGEGTRPTRGRFCRGCRPGALTRRGATGP